MTWNRQLWGVEFRGRVKEDKPMLLGQAWHRVEMAKPTYEGEPTRALLFTTREACRNWCRERQNANLDLGWKFIPVKVRELVEKVPNAGDHAPRSGRVD